jgi:hypothetical protein
MRWIPAFNGTRGKKRGDGLFAESFAAATSEKANNATLPAQPRNLALNFLMDNPP